MCGGLFVSQTESPRYAVAEANYCPQAIVVAAGFLELNLRASKKVAANGAGRGNCARISAQRTGSARRFAA
jgi:hypothetical protein